MPLRERLQAQKNKRYESAFYRNNNFDDNPEVKDTILTQIKEKIREKYHYDFNVPAKSFEKWDYMCSASDVELKYCLD